MTALLRIIGSADVSIYQFLNGFAGNRILDSFANFAEGCSLLKGGLFLAIYWYFWVKAAPDRDRRRRAIVAVATAAMLALVAARAIADLAAYRVRPIYDLHLHHLPFSFPASHDFVNWSSFPSDHAAFFFALAFGLAYVSRRLAIPAMLYVAGWICLPRMFLGLHYASDVVAGAVIGIATVWLLLKAGWIQSRPATWVLTLAEAKPEVFCVAVFLVSFEMGALFDDVRLAARTVYRVAQGVAAGEFHHAGAAATAALGLLAVAGYGCFRFARGCVRRRTSRQPVHSSAAAYD